MTMSNIFCLKLVSVYLYSNANSESIFLETDVPLRGQSSVVKSGHVSHSEVIEITPCDSIILFRAIILNFVP